MRVSSSQLRTALLGIIDDAGTSGDATSDAGRWSQFADASEELAGSTSAANDNIAGYMLRSAVALESLAGTDGDAENHSYTGSLKRIVDALEALGDAGAGSWAERFAVGAPAAVFAAEGSPGAIADLVATAQSDTEIELVFTPSVDATSHEYRVDGGSAVACDDNTGTQPVTGLTAATEYDFQVRGVNGIGNGPWSNTGTESTNAESDTLDAPVVTVTSAAGVAPEFEVETLAEYMGLWLDVQVADNNTEDFSVLSQDISYQIQMSDLPPGSITHEELALEGYTSPTGPWSIRFRIRRDDGLTSSFDVVSGEVTGSTAVLATVTGTAKHTSYDTATYSGLGGRMTANVGGNRGARATVAVTGKRHWEVTIEQISAVAGNKFVMGMCDLAADMSASVLPGSSGALGAGIRVADNSNNITQLRNGSVASTTNMGSPIAVGDVYVMEFDTVANTVSFWRHRGGTDTLIYGPTTLTSQIPTDWVPTVQGYNTDDRVSVNFGAGAWAKAPTTDYAGW